MMTILSSLLVAAFVTPSKLSCCHSSLPCTRHPSVRLSEQLEPELISIAGVYRTSDVALPEQVRGKPTQIRLDGGADGKLVMDPILLR